MIAVGEPFSLVGRHVELVPLDRAHAAELTEAASGDRSTYEFTTVPATGAEMAAYIDRLLADRDAQRVIPFTQRRASDGRLVGCTRFMDLHWWRDRGDPDEVEIGGTWLAQEAQRTPVNTEAKLLLLTHAFDVWRVTRVALCTDARNEQSRAAIARLGARFEGVLRHHRASHVVAEHGRPRDSAMFAITEDDWPAVRTNLTARLARP